MKVGSGRTALRRTALAAALLAGFATPGWAQAQAQSTGSAPAARPAAAQSLSWSAIPGSAVDLSIGADGAVFALDSEGQVWLRRPVAETAGTNNATKGGWSHLPGKFARIAAASERLAWAVDAEGVPYQWRGTWWRPMNDSFDIAARDVGVGPGGLAAAITRAGKVVVLDARGAIDLSALPEAPADAERIDVDEQERIWITTRDGAVHRYANRRWQALPGVQARDLSAAGSGAGGPWLLAPDGELGRLSADGRSVQRFAARAAVVAGAPNGKPWIATADGAVYANDPATVARARTSRPTETQVFTQLLNWQRVSGKAKQLAISARGAVLALGTQGELWHWKGKNQWGTLSGQFERIALGADGTPWAIDGNGRVLRYQGNYWQDSGAGKSRLLAASPDGSVWVLADNGKLALWQPRLGQWLTPDIAPLAAGTRALALGADGRPWIVDAEGNVRQHDGKRWQTLPEIGATTLGLSPEGIAFVTDGEQRLWRWDTAGKRWERLNGEASGVAAGPRGTPWVLRGNDLYAAGFFDELPESKVATVSAASAGATANGVQVRSPQVGAGGTATTGTTGSAGGQAPGAAPGEVLSFQKLAGAPRALAIGAEGSVFGINFDGALIRWNNGRNAFLGFPGQLARITVAPDGKPWGVTGKGEVFRHDGSDWRPIYNIVASDIDVAYDGTVMVIGPQNVLHKYNPATQAFERLSAPAENDPSPGGVRLALDPQATPWVILADGFVAACPKLLCTRTTQRARDIDIGPEGSVYIVDVDRVLRRWNERSLSFERLNTVADPLDRVAVGPRGKPWLLNLKGEVWSSALFARDESRDITTAAASSAGTSIATTPGTTAPPVFTFTINMPFEIVPNPFSPANPRHLAFNSIGKLVAIDTANKFWNYNTTSKTFTLDTSVPDITPPLLADQIRGFAVGPDGVLWVTNEGIQTFPKVWRRQGSQWISVPGVDDCASTPGCSPPGSAASVNVGPDGSIYATSSGNNILRYDTAQQRFVKITTLPHPPGGAAFIAVDPNNRFWAASPSWPGPAKLYEFDGSSWQVRTDAVIGAPSQCLVSTTPCVAISANGATYGLGAQNKLVRWNAASKVWETLSGSPNGVTVGAYTAAPDGRPWLIGTPGDPPTIYKAR